MVRGTNSTRRRRNQPQTYSSTSNQAKPRRRAQPNQDDSVNNGPTNLHDVYDYAVSQQPLKKGKGKVIRRAIAGVHEQDGEEEEKNTRGKRKRNMEEEDDDDEEEEQEQEEGQGRKRKRDGLIGPKVFDSDDEVDAEIEGKDEELDSDEAFGESDDEKFQDWRFGSKQTGGRKTQEQEGDGMDLSRMLDSDQDDEEEDTDDDDKEDDEKEADEKLQRHLDSMQDGLEEQGDELQDDASSLKPSRRVLSERTEAMAENEFAASAGSVLELQDLLDPLSGQIDFAHVRQGVKSLESTSIQGRTAVASKKGGSALAAPLPTIVQDRLDRSAAYSLTKQEVQGWQPTIKMIREAQHLSFPLQKPQETKISNAGLVSTFKPSNDMEAQIADMLESGGLTEKQLAQQEDLAINQLDPTELKERRLELRRMRDLMFRAELKAKRVKKIKSKAYRKIRRKEKERLEEQMKELGMSLTGDGDDDLDVENEVEEMEERLKAEKHRAIERATLKHKNTSKWAKQILSSRHGEHTRDARGALEEQLQRGEKLRRRIQGKNSDDESEEDDDSDDDDYNEAEDQDQIRDKAFDELASLEDKEKAKRERDEAQLESSGGNKGVYHMKFMKDARARDLQNVRGMVDDFKNEMEALGNQDDDEDDDSDGGEISNGKLAKSGAAAAATTSTTFVKGNKGRAIFGAGSIQSTSTPGLAVPQYPDAGKDVAVDGISNGRKKKSNSGSLVHDDSSPHKKPTVEKPLQVGDVQSNPHSISNPFLPNDVSAAGTKEQNPWLLVASSSSDHPTQKISKKRNQPSMSTSATFETKSSNRLTKAKDKTALSQSAKRQDELVELNVDAHLVENDDDDDEEEEPMATIDHQRRTHPNAFQQRELVSQAFASDDVTAEFESEKTAMIQAQAPKQIDTTLPGWGSWTGKGIKTSKSKPSFSVTLPGLDPNQRKDRNMKNVIINQKKDKKVEKFQTTDLPFPFTSKAQYEMAMKNPLGPEWNTTIETNRLNMPRVTKKLGKVIKPIERKF